MRHSREPPFKVEFLDRGIVELPRDNIHDPVGDPQGLVKFLGGLDHLFLHFLGRLEVSVADDKLLDFIKLVHPKDAPAVFPMRARLLPEAGRYTPVF